MDLKARLGEIHFFKDDTESEELKVRFRAPYLRWVLKSELVAKANVVPINACLPIAINHMVGSVLFNSIIDFLSFQAHNDRESLDAHLIRFILERGIRLKPNRTYFHMWDDHAM